MTSSKAVKIVTKKPHLPNLGQCDTKGGQYCSNGGQKLNENRVINGKKCSKEREKKGNENTRKGSGSKCTF